MNEKPKLVTYKCAKCNAEVVTAESTIATKCAYCGRALILTEKFIGNFKPSYIVPFKIPKETAVQMFVEFFNGSKRTPLQFKKNIEEEVQGLYVPYWLFSCDADTKISYSAIKKSQAEGKIDSYSLSATIAERMENIPEDAVKSIDNYDLRMVEPFKYFEMQPFSPGYMAGFYAEEYDDNIEELKLKAEKRIHKSTLANNAQHIFPDFPNAKYEASSIESSNWTAYYAMMPLWILHREYRKKDYIYIINGQTGKMSGYIPKSIEKERKKMINIWLVLTTICTLMAVLPQINTINYKIIFSILTIAILCGLTTLAINKIFISPKEKDDWRIGRQPPDRTYLKQVGVVIKDKKIKKIEDIRRTQV